MKKWVLIVSLAVAPLPAASQDYSGPSVYVKNGFHTGTTYLQLSHEQRAGYAAGLLDGIFVSSVLGAKGDVLDRLQNCAVGMSDIQLVAVFDKYLRDNPGRWHQSMHVLGYSALLAACPSLTS